MKIVLPNTLNISDVIQDVDWAGGNVINAISARCGSESGLIWY